MDRAVARSRPTAELIGMLRPGIDHLVHAWLPGARGSRTLDRIWQELDRIRDQLSVCLVEALKSFNGTTEKEDL